MTVAPRCGHWVADAAGEPVHTPVLSCSTCAGLVHARVLAADDPAERPIELSPPCTSCGDPVDVREPHVVFVMLMQTRTKGATRTHARREVGTWHKPCSRMWPVPMQRKAPAEEDTA